LWINRDQLAVDRLRFEAVSSPGCFPWLGMPQRMKDSPDPLVRDERVTRYRLEWRTRF
jgi:hypothetical protein